MSRELEISVVVPVHNAQKTIKRAVESLLNQADVGLEIILVENGSSDNSAEICKQLSQQYVNIIYVQDEALGVSHARNCGIDYANGSYLGFMDADDYADKEMYITLRNGMESVDAELAICEYCIEKHGQTQVTNQLGFLTSDKAAELRALMVGRAKESDPVFLSSVWRCLYIKDLIIKHNIRFPEGQAIGEDVIFNLNYLEKVDSVFRTEKALYHYVENENSVSNRFRIDMWDMYKIYLESLVTYILKNDCPEDYYMRVMDKVHSMSSWIAMEYATSDLPRRERIVYLERIYADRKKWLKNNQNNLEYGSVDFWLTEQNFDKILRKGDIIRMKKRMKRILIKS